MSTTVADRLSPTRLPLATDRFQHDDTEVITGSQKQEVDITHQNAAARGDNVTCVMANNGTVVGSDGHMTIAGVPDPPTWTSPDGRDATSHELANLFRSPLIETDVLAS